MSDDLVKRARHNALADMPHYASVELIEAMAARIEELEAKLEMAVAELERLGFDFQCIVGRELKGQADE